MEDVPRSRVRVAPGGEVGGQPSRSTASAMFQAILGERLHVDVRRLAEWVRAHPGCRDVQFRLAFGLRHVPHPGSGNELTAAESAEVMRGLLAEVATDDHHVRNSTKGVRTKKARDPIPARVILCAFLTQCVDRQTETTLRWCRSFPDAALQIIEAASILTLGALGRPPTAAVSEDGADPRRRERLIARAQAILDAEAHGKAGANGAHAGPD